MEISTIIVNYKSEGFLENCLKSLQKHLDDLSFEIIIVNNGSENLKLLEKISEKYNAKLINSKKNIGFGAACNLGTENSIGEFLFFINPDTEIISLFGKTLNDIKILKVDICGGNLINLSGKPQEFSCGSFFTLKTLFFNKIINKSYNARLKPRSLDRGIWAGSSLKASISAYHDRKVGVVDKPWLDKFPIEVDWVSGGAMIIKKDLFKKLNGFDKEYFMYLEDQDLCHRARKMGFNIKFLPDFLIKHHKDPTMNKSKLVSYNKSLKRYFKKHNNFIENISLTIIKPIYDFIKYGQNLKS